jgi:hypothetical protein
LHIVMNLFRGKKVDWREHQTWTNKTLLLLNMKYNMHSFYRISILLDVDEDANIG